MSEKLKISISLDDLRAMLQDQKERVVDHLINDNYRYNTNSENGHLKTLPIDKVIMKKVAMETGFPNEFNTLLKYLTE